MTDTRSLQQGLVDQLRQNGTLTSDAVAEAFLAVPRHLFLPAEPLERAYEDIAIQVKAGPDGRWTSSSSQPSMMAIMLEQLDLRPGMRVLEIGAGTGYNAALMAALVGPAGSVTAVDIQPDLVEDARAHLQAAGVANAQVVHGDGGYGWPAGAPYDRIILTAASPVIAPAWREQLAAGGRLVLPLDLGGAQVSTAFEKRGEALVSLSLHGCGFMPLQGGFAAEPVWAELAPGVNQVCAHAPGHDSAALAGWLAGAGETGQAEAGRALRSGVRMKADDLWGGLNPWLALRLPERMCSLTSDDDSLSALPELLPALRGALTSYPLGERTGRMWLLLPGAEAAALLRRVPGPDTPAGERFELEVLPLGADTSAAGELLDALRAWDAAGRPRIEQLHIRAAAAGTNAPLEPGEQRLPRPWTDFMVRFFS